jgi:hypothetical protein
VAQWKKILERVLSGRSDASVVFVDLCSLLSRLGFTERIEGDHHLFSKTGIEEIINIPPLKDSKAKPYQVR